MLVLLGIIRELLGTGALFADMQLLFGAGAKGWRLQIFAVDFPFGGDFTPGAFLVTGCLIALKNRLTEVWSNAQLKAEAPVAGSKRVRVTGTVS